MSNTKFEQLIDNNQPPKPTPSFPLMSDEEKVKRLSVLLKNMNITASK